MKRYRKALDPNLLQMGIKKVVMAEDEEGPWLKYEDVLEILTDFCDNLKYSWNIDNPKRYAEWIIEDYGKDFVR